MKNAFSCIVVDDEQDAAELLIARINLLYTNVDIQGCFTTWQDALNALRTLTPDIIFMDISMPGKNGLDLLRLAPKLHSEIIFVKAHEEYALRAFEFATSGYILKPIDDVELSQSIERAMKRVRDKQKSTVQENPRIGIPDNKGVNYVNLMDIEYLESVQGYTRVVTKDGVILTSFNLGKFKSVITSERFYQVHRSYIVNINAIVRYKSTGEIVMKDNKEIPVSKAARQDFLNMFNMVSRSGEHEEG